jgi:MFS transporter, ACS family, solute carrier family 17 (sodium-dependent inorganic phosphate cotransporter), other
MSRVALLGMWRARFTLSAFCFTALALSYMDRWNLSIAAPLLKTEFGWTETRIGLLQSVFFWGFTLTHLPGGWLADRFGGRRVLGLGTLGWSLATAATPLAGSFGSFATARVALGLGEGMNMPSISSLVARWFPLEERTRATVVNLAGIHVGTLVALPLSAWIADTWGWRAAFYAYAAIGLVWVTLWVAWRPDGPTAAGDVRVERVPWNTFLREPAVRALLATTFVTNWTAWFMYSWMPMYLIQAHGFSLKGSGLAAAVPNLAMILGGLVSGWLADRLILQGVVPTRVRRGLLVGGFAGAAAFLLAIPHVATAYGAVACLTGALACFAFGASTVLVNSLDLAPRHAGVLVGLQGTAGNIAGMLSPVLGGAIATSTGSWNLNFYLIAALLAAGALVWTRWSSGEPITPVPVRPSAGPWLAPSAPPAP